MHTPGPMLHHTASAIVATVTVTSPDAACCEHPGREEISPPIPAGSVALIFIGDEGNVIVHGEPKRIRRALIDALFSVPMEDVAGGPDADVVPFHRPPIVRALDERLKDRAAVLLDLGDPGPWDGPDDEGAS